MKRRICLILGLLLIAASVFAAADKAPQQTKKPKNTDKMTVVTPTPKPKKTPKPDWAKIRKSEAWYQAADGTIVYGKLAEICAGWLKSDEAENAEATVTVYICRDDVFKLKKISRMELARFNFQIDIKALPKKTNYHVYSAPHEPGKSGKKPSDASKRVSYWVWLVKDGQPTPTATKAPTPSPTPTATPQPTGTRGPGPFSYTPRRPHAKARYPVLHGFDQVGLDALEGDAALPMDTLTLAGEAMPLSLRREDKPSFFVPSLIREELETVEENDPETQDILLLTAVSDRTAETLLAEAEATPTPRTWAVKTETPSPSPTPAVTDSPAEVLPCVWSLNGELLRKLNRSGIAALALQAGDRVLILPTDGFLAGTYYDEWKMRGVSGRRFDYEISMAENEDPVITFTLEGNVYTPSTEENPFLYVTDVRIITASELFFETESTDPEDDASSG